MTPFQSDPRGSIVRIGNMLSINPALVEEVSARDQYLIVSYAVNGPNQDTLIENLRLNVGHNTIIFNSFGMPVSLNNIEAGSWIHVWFSSAMTRSLPPQAQAYLIIVRSNPQPQPDNVITTDRVVSIDPANGFLYTGDPHNINSQMRFTIASDTRITNQYGNPIPLWVIQPGQMVRITHANFQTASIPPQTTAYQIELI